MKKTLAIVLTLCLALACLPMTAFAAPEDGAAAAGSFAGADFDYTQFKPGATLVKNGTPEAQGLESPTGYFVVFIYEEQDGLVYLASDVPEEVTTSNYVGPFQELYDTAPLGEIDKVQLKANTMMLFSYDSQDKHTTLEEAKGILPENYTNDKALYPAGGDGTTINGAAGTTGKINYLVDMTRMEGTNGKDWWTVAVPLSSGAFDYNYRITDQDGHTATPIQINGTQTGTTAAGASDWMPDPNNPPMSNPVTGGQSRSSMVYVPYDAAYQAVADAPYSVDRHVQVPLAVNYGADSAAAKQAGTVKADQYESETLGGKRGIAVYLPNGYSEDSEPYNVLYLSHGAQSEYIGNEWRWMNEISAGNIMDNLIYEGKVKTPFIIVSIDNKVMWNSEFTSMTDREAMYQEVMEIVSYVEKNYNVVKDASGRAYAGLSMGAFSGSWITANHPESFGYFGLWSGGLDSLLTAENLEKIRQSGAQIHLGYGDWDWCMGSVDAVAAKLQEAGIPFRQSVVPGSHDWNVWSLLLAETAEDFFFQDSAAQAAADYSKYDKGVTVEKNPASPTGYTATFVYEQLPAYTTAAGETLGDIAKVELYSDCMMLFHYDQQSSGVGINPDNAHPPEEFKPGMYPAGGSGDTAYNVEMVSLGNGLWGAQIPLSSGAFVYNFRVTDEAGTVLSRLDDPSNPTVTNTATGVHSLSSMVYVPYDSAAQGTGAWSDRSVELPQADAAERGTVETVAYTGADGTQHGLAVYLPAGYDRDRSEPYKVLYLSHGTSGDIYGNELRWMNEGAVANIMDNLIAAGKTEAFVVVTMNNQQYSEGEGHSGPNWKYADIETDQIDCIMPYVEANYNVSKTASGRAYAGLSMGGSTASNMLMHQPELFGYYGIWSYANVDGSVGGTAGIQDAGVQKSLTSLASKPGIMLAAGSWDFGLEPVKSFGAVLDQLGLKYSFLEVPAAHDWECWQLTYAYAAEHFFWKDDSADLPRSGLVSRIYAMDGSPAVSGSSFSDVADGSAYASAVKWAMDKGLVSGYGDGRFCPDKSITWEQALSILYKFAASKGCDMSAKDTVSAPVSNYAKNAVEWAAGSGLVSAGSLKPFDTVSQGEMTAVLKLFSEKLLK